MRRHLFVGSYYVVVRLKVRERTYRPLLMMTCSRSGVCYLDMLVAVAAAADWLTSTRQCVVDFDAGYAAPLFSVTVLTRVPK